MFVGRLGRWHRRRAVQDIFAPLERTKILQVSIAGVLVWGGRGGGGGRWHAASSAQFIGTTNSLILSGVPRGPVAAACLGPVVRWEEDVALKSMCESFVVSVHLSIIKVLAASHVARPFRVASTCMHRFLAAQPLWSTQANSGLGFMRTLVCKWRSHLALLTFRLIAFHLPHHRHRKAAHIAHNTWATCGHDQPMGSNLAVHNSASPATLLCNPGPTQTGRTQHLGIMQTLVYLWHTLSA